MLVANSFDLWQKDAFFSAAEEVQKSADIMESAYRTWLRARKEGSQHLDELCRELQLALGTAKWQLEEFEKAVRLSYGKNVDDITRHRLFISALEDKIFRVEEALKESFIVEGKKPFRWVNLAEEDCEDFAMFLSGTPGPRGVKNESIFPETEVSSSSGKKCYMKEECSLSSEVSSKTQTSGRGKNLEVGLNKENAKCIIDLEEGKSSEMGDDGLRESDRITNRNYRITNRNWNSDRIALDIVIDCENRQKDSLLEATPKEKGARPSFWRPRREGSFGAEGRLLTQCYSKFTDS